LFRTPAQKDFHFYRGYGSSFERKDQSQTEKHRQKVKTLRLCVIKKTLQSKEKEPSGLSVFAANQQKEDKTAKIGIL
jgi:hypothetical protein